MNTTPQLEGVSIRTAKPVTEERPDPADAEESSSSDRGNGGGGGKSGKTEESEESSTPSELPLNSVFEILKNQRRRHTLRYLSDNEQPVTLSELAEYIAAEENDKTPREVNSKERKRAYVGLYQCHLPKMSELGAIDYNRDRGLIEMDARADQLFEYIQESEDSRDWPVYYLSLAGGATVIYLGTILAGIAAGPVGLALCGLTIASFGVLAAHHAASTRTDE